MGTVMSIVGTVAFVIAAIAVLFILTGRTVRKRDREIIYTSFPKYRPITAAQLQLLAQARWPKISYGRVLDALWRSWEEGEVLSDQPDDFGRALNRDALWFALHLP